MRPAAIVLLASVVLCIVSALESLPAIVRTVALVTAFALLPVALLIVLVLSG